MFGFLGWVELEGNPIIVSTNLDLKTTPSEREKGLMLRCAPSFNYTMHSNADLVVSGGQKVIAGSLLMKDGRFMAFTM